MYIICIWVYTQCKSAATIYFHHTSVYAMYIPCIYLTYTYIYSSYNIYVLFSESSWHSSPTRAALSGLSGQLARRTRWGWFWFCVCWWVPASTNILFYYWMCLSDLACHNPGVQQHSIKFCRHASSLTERELTFTPSRQLSSSHSETDLYHGVMRARCYPFNMERHRFRG